MSALAPLVPARTGERVPAVDGSGVVARELLQRATTEFPALLGLSERERLLVAAWLSSLRSARTRRAYWQDAQAWMVWCEQRGVDVLPAGQMLVDLWGVGLVEARAEVSTTRRRLSGLSSFYRYLAGHDLVVGNRRSGWIGRAWMRITPPPSV